MTETESLEALEAAIREHVRAHGDGAYLTDWVLIAAAATRDDADATTYVCETSGGPMHHKLGLVRYLSNSFDRHLDHDEDE